MDSLTQIVLGAAVAEVVLGKKIGNKAMLWGGVAGTIPDLDVLTQLFFDDLTSNEMHRGFSHSILFCLIASPLLARWIKSHKASLFATFIFLLFLVFVRGADTILSQFIMGAMALTAIILIFRHGNNPDNGTVWDWTKLFWWCLVTHPFLDCHTTWGTQILWPLQTRFAWNNIFVVDPFYTVPFLVCVVIAMFFSRQSRARRIINWTGIGLSTMYMAVTLVTKYIAHNSIKESLLRQEVEYSHISTRPTPFNCILWATNVRVPEGYLLGMHSLLDTKPEVEFIEVERNKERLGNFVDHRNVKRLIALTDDNYAVTFRGDTMIFNDLRFGQMGDPEEGGEFVFAYKLIPKGKDLLVELIPPPEPKGEEMDKAMSELWERIKGE